jgi:hypothetical protein
VASIPAVPLSRRAVFWSLGAVLLATLPAPYFLGDFEVAPPLRLLFLSGLFVGVALSEGAHGNQLLLTLLAALQALLWLGGVGAASAVLTRLLERVGAARLAAVGMLAAALVLAALLPIYTTPMSSHAPRSSILGIFD